MKRLLEQVLDFLFLGFLITTISWSFETALAIVFEVI